MALMASWQCLGVENDSRVDKALEIGVMKTAMNDIFMHDQQPVIAMITRSSP